MSSLRFMGGLNQLKRFRAFGAFPQMIRNKLAKAKDAHALCNNLGEFFLRNLKERPRKESCRTENQVYDVLFTGGVDPSKTNK